MKQLAYVLDNHKEVFSFLKTRFPLYHQSNFFFRDVQYGILTMLERKGMKVGYTDAEIIAQEFVQKLEREKIFLPIDRQTWVVNYPEYRKPVVRSAAARPAGPAAAALRPATAVGARPAVPAVLASPRPVPPGAPKPVAAAAAPAAAPAPLVPAPLAPAPLVPAPLAHARPAEAVTPTPTSPEPVAPKAGNEAAG